MGERVEKGGEEGEDEDAQEEWYVVGVVVWSVWHPSIFLVTLSGGFRREEGGDVIDDPCFEALSAPWPTSTRVLLTTFTTTS